MFILDYESITDTIYIEHIHREFSTIKEALDEIAFLKRSPLLHRNIRLLEGKHNDK